MNITAHFLSAAEKFPANTAITDSNGSVSYRQLEGEVKQTAAYFRKKGIDTGDRVLVFVPMSTDLYRVVLALFYLGATVVFLDEWVNKKRLELCCEMADCKGFIGTNKARALGWFSREIRNIPVKLSLSKQENQAAELVRVDTNHPALITFTTGSTGRPKAAVRSHQALHEQFKALVGEINPKPSDSDMPVLPVVLFVNLGIGCTSVIADFKMRKPESLDARVVARQIEKHKVNRITASPFFIKKLSQFLAEGKNELSTVEKICTGGAPVFPAEAELYQWAFPSAQIKIIYGSTEAEPISAIDSRELIQRSEELSKGLPVGRPYRESTVKIIEIREGVIAPQSEEDFRNLFLQDGQIGEIIVSGPHVLKQYFNNEEAFRQNKIAIGETTWHRTGDSGFTGEGELFLTGRCKQLIQTESGLLSPFIIENRLLNIDGVNMGTLLKMNGKLVLVLETSLTKEDLAPQMEEIPFGQLRIVKKIPRDPRHNSKIDYEQLRNSL